MAFGPKLVRYPDGTEVTLGDVISVPIPTGTALGRIVMLGDSYEHLEIDEGFLSWVNRERLLADNSAVIEWVNDNPFKHDDPRYAPVGDYMFTPIDQWVSLVSRANGQADGNVDC